MIFFLRTQGWSRQTVDGRVLTPLSQSSIMGTPAGQGFDHVLSASGIITKNGQPIRGGGEDINATDAAFAGRIYPKMSERAPSIQADVIGPRR